MESLIHLLLFCIQSIAISCTRCAPHMLLPLSTVVALSDDDDDGITHNFSHLVSLALVIIKVVFV